MKLFSKMSALGAVLVLSTAFAAAETISLGSYGANVGNGGVATPAGTFNNSALTSGGNATYNISSGSAWAPAVGSSSWVSFDPNSGPTGGNVDPNGTYTYTTTFTAQGGTYSGSMVVMADDTTNVLLNGVEIIPPGALGNNTHCADNAPTCLIQFNFNLDPVTLLNGLNTLTFNVQQTALVYQGLDFAGSLSNGSPTPEPGTLLLLGTGLVGSAGALMRRMKASALK
jgi:hypothetical protein